MDIGLLRFGRPEQQFSPKSKITSIGLASQSRLARDLRGKGTERGGGTARHDTSRAVPNFTGFICLFCRCRRNISQPKVEPRSCCHAGGQYLARADRLAQWVGALFWHV